VLIGAVILSAPLSATAVEPPAPFQIKGFNINLYGRDRLNRAPSLQTVLDQLASTGSNTVLVTTPYFQATSTSNEVFSDRAITETDDDLVVLFSALQARGLRVAYKFTLIPRDGTWSGAIQPSAPSAWFASYQAHLVRLAALCQAHGVTLLYVANEMQSMAKPVYATQWNAVIDAVRHVYAGQLSWNAVLGKNLGSEAFSLPIVSRLDHIGLSAYEPLTDKLNPTVGELAAAWYGNRLGINLVEMVKTLHAMTGKPIVFSELSYRSVDGNNIAPYNWEARPGDVFDPQEQADCYEAFMRVWATENQSWMLGVLWWDWLVDPEFGRANNQHPQDLPAQAVVTRWFGGTLPATTLAAAVLPSSRAVQANGGVATAFATVINTGPATAYNVSLAPALVLPAAFSYQTTDCSSNVTTGTANTPTYVPPGQKACFVFAIAPMAAMEPLELPLVFAGENTAPVPPLPGINTLLVSASTVAGPDIIALAATPGNDGVAATLGTPRAGAFAVATANVGASGGIIVSADTGSASVPVSLAVCQTDPGRGTCLAPPAGTVSAIIEAGGMPTFACSSERAHRSPWTRLAPGPSCASRISMAS
jgi:hypothetical protein